MGENVKRIKKHINSTYYSNVIFIFRVLSYVLKNEEKQSWNEENIKGTPDRGKVYPIAMGKK